MKNITSDRLDRPDPATLEILDRLVAFDTTSHKSNLAAVHYIAECLGTAGISATLIQSPDGRKANLFATLGPRVPGGVILSGHTDVVPVEGQDWSVEPWKLTERDGKLYGRGTADMKGFLAAALALVTSIRPHELQRPLHLAFSYDEEVGCFGVPSLIDCIRDEAPRPHAVIVGEPTGMAVVNAHKATYGARTTVRGLEGHSSLPALGLNACVYGARVASFLSELAEELAARARPETGPKTNFVPPCSTINVGSIHGGTARNIIPSACVVEWDCRLLPDDDPDEVLERVKAFCDDELLPEMRASHAGASIETDRLSFMPGLSPEGDTSAETLVKRLLGTNESAAVSYGTEAGFFQQSAFSTVICGPGRIDQAHKPDEFLEMAQLAACERFLSDLARALATGELADGPGT